MGDSKFNGWMNWGASQITGAPSGNTGTNNPGATQSPAGSSVGSTISDGIAKLFVRGIVVILGFIFVAVGLTMLGTRTKVGQEIVREVRKVV